MKSLVPDLVLSMPLRLVVSVNVDDGYSRMGRRVGRWGDREKN